MATEEITDNYPYLERIHEEYDKLKVDGYEKGYLETIGMRLANYQLLLII